MMKTCEMCSEPEVRTGAYGDTYRTKIQTIEIPSEAYADSFLIYTVCGACEDYLKSSK